MMELLVLYYMFKETMAVLGQFVLAIKPTQIVHLTVYIYTKLMVEMFLFKILVNKKIILTKLNLVNLMAKLQKTY